MTSLTSSSTSNSPGEPEAYRIGHVPFLGATIWLDSRPLIPRTETEWWVEQFVKSLELRVEGEIRVLDLFAGSGCIGVAVLTHIPNAHVTFGELEEKHLTTIKKNLETNGVESRGTVVHTDVFSNIHEKYDFILANPPYLSRARVERIEGSVLAHEPHEALFAEDDGFALIAATLAGLPEHLTPEGQCWIEHEPEHAARIVGGTTHKDQYGVLRYSVILQA